MSSVSLADRAIAVVRATAEAAGLGVERVAPTRVVLTLPGTHRLATTVVLTAGDHALTVEAFFCRAPDENHAEVYRWLLQRNSRTYGVHYALDHLGDIYLVGRVALEHVSPEEVDRLLGAVLDNADEPFDTVLRMGFASAIRREWAWRTARGESLANLAAFAGLVAEGTGPGAQAGTASAATPAAALARTAAGAPGEARTEPPAEPSPEVPPAG